MIIHYFFGEINFQRSVKYSKRVQKVVFPTKYGFCFAKFSFALYYFLLFPFFRTLLSRRKKPQATNFFANFAFLRDNLPFRGVVVANNAVAKSICVVYNIVMTDSQRKQINILIAQISQGNVFALEGLSRLVSGRMLSVAMSVVKNKSLAEDVVQDSFVKILQNSKSFSQDTNGYAWICKIVQNVALNTLRREKRFKSENIDDCFDLASCLNVAEQSTAAVALQQAMSVLNKLEKLVIYEKYFMDYTVRDISQSVKKSKSATQRLITKAEEKMRRALKGEPK